MNKVRLITVTDLNQSRSRTDQLLLAVQQHWPDGVAFVGDFLDALIPHEDQHTYDLDQSQDISPVKFQK